MIPSTLPPERERQRERRQSTPRSARTTPRERARDTRPAASDEVWQETLRPDLPRRWARSLPLSHLHVAWTETLHRRRLSGALANVTRSAFARRMLAGVMLLLVLSLACFTLAWNLTPSTTNLRGWVRGQDAARAVPYTSIAAISPNIVHALIAIEDERFYQHHGIDTIGLTRALLTDLAERSAVQGGSTLTAQLAKNAYLNGYDHTVKLKLEDLLLALKIEHSYSKSAILEMYLNLVYFGEGAYGVGAASERYFGIPPSKLDIAQAALLAGLVQAPGMYDPWCHPNLSHGKQKVVLAHMATDGYITLAQGKQALAEHFSFFDPGAKRPNDAYCAA